MSHRIALAVEGPSDRAVVETLCKRKGHVAKAGSADGKDDLFLKFHKLLRVLDATFHPTHFVVVADLHPAVDCPAEAARWRAAIHDRFRKAELCLSIWELEAWLLADPSAVGMTVRRPNFRHANPERIGDPKPSTVLEDLYHEAGGYGRGKAYDKEADGARLAGEVDLEVAAKNSPSLSHFLRVLESRQERLS